MSDATNTVRLIGPGMVGAALVPPVSAAGLALVRDDIDAGLRSPLEIRQAMRRIVAVLAAGYSAAANAHSGEPIAPHDFWLAWNTEPWLLALLALAGGLYALGAHELWRESGSGRGLPQWRAGAFCAGWLALIVALVSPLDALGGRSFALHMVQHELLMLVAAPLLVLGKPLAVWAWALPQSALKFAAAAVHAEGWRTFWQRLTAPAAAWSLHAAALWAWHAPALFQAGLQSEAVHVLQHASFLLSALLFWWAVLRGRAGAMAVLYVFTTLLHTGFLGALLTFAPAVWYPAYGGTAPFGLTPLEDQQLGGLIMWVPAGAILMLAGLALLAQWLLPSAPRTIAAARGRDRA